MAGDVVKPKFRRHHLLRIVASNLVRCLFRDAARSWGRNFGATAPALGSMTLLLLMAGLVGVTGYALRNLEQQQAAQASLLHVYLRDGAAGPDIIALWDQLAADPRVSKVTYITKDEALARAQSIPGLPELANASESNPFPASLDVQVRNIKDVGAIDAVARKSSIAAAASSPAAMPASFSGPSGIVASAAARRMSRPGVLAGRRVARVR